MLGEYQPDIKPCPFCGGPADRLGPSEWHCDTSDEVIQVGCANCDVYMDLVTQAPTASWIDSKWDGKKYGPLSDLERTERNSFWIRKWEELIQQWNTRKP